jgi:hypothetical protein
LRTDLVTKLVTTFIFAFGTPLCKLDCIQA